MLYRLPPPTTYQETNAAQMIAPGTYVAVRRNVNVAISATIDISYTKLIAMTVRDRNDRAQCVVRGAFSAR